MIEKMVKNSNAAYLTQIEISQIRYLDAPSTSAVLLDILRDSKNASHTSRAFHALMILENFDQLEFLIGFYDESSDSGWKAACLRSLPNFNHPKAIAKLCDVLVNSDDLDLRFIAAEALEMIASPLSLYALEYARENDTGLNFNDESIAFMASKAIKKNLAQQPN